LDGSAHPVGVEAGSAPAFDNEIDISAIGIVRKISDRRKGFERYAARRGERALSETASGDAFAIGAQAITVFQQDRAGQLVLPGGHRRVQTRDCPVR
jgi:hypothetical protein